MSNSTQLDRDQGTENQLPEMFADLTDVVEYGARYVDPSKRAVFEGEAKEQLASAIDSLSNLAMKYANGNRELLRDVCNDVRTSAEEIVRLHRLRHPSSKEQFFSDVAWAGEQGDTSVLRALEALPGTSSSYGMAGLIERSKHQIATRTPATRDLDDSGGGLANRTTFIAVLFSCFALAAIGAIWLPGSPLGFCLAFGGALVGYECFLVLRQRRQ